MAQHSCHGNNCFLAATALLKTKIAVRNLRIFSDGNSNVNALHKQRLNAASIFGNTDWFFFPASSLPTGIKPAHKHCSAKGQKPMRASISKIISMAVKILLIPEAVWKIASSCCQGTIDTRMNSSLWCCQYQLTFFSRTSMPKQQKTKIRNISVFLP